MSDFFSMSRPRTAIMSGVRQLTHKDLLPGRGRSHSLYGFSLTTGHERRKLRSHEQAASAHCRKSSGLANPPENRNGPEKALPLARPLLASGQAPSRLALAKLVAVHRHTSQTWLKLSEVGGLSTLLTIKKAPGKRPSLTPHILTKLQTRLNHNQGFGSYGEIQQYLAHEHKLSLAYSTVHALVRYKLQAKPKSPRRSHPKKA